MAQRVMDCGDAGHILLSKRIADDLAQYGRWRSQLHELGEVEVKHGVRVSISNFFNAQVGNSSLSAKYLEQRAQKAELVSRSRRKRNLFLGAALLSVLLVGGAFFFVRQRTNVATAGKWIAVLPFENIAPDKAKSYFVEGLQDDITDSLTKIKDLTVVSRSAVRGYRDASRRSLPEIGRQLGVTHVLEGSVRQAANHVVVNVRLSETGSGRQVWSEHYDRTMPDLLSLQGALAIDVAHSLRALLSPAERRSLEIKPTNNVQAYLLYLKGRDVENVLRLQETDWEAAGKFYQQAIELDPSFALARARLSIANSWLSQGTRGNPVRQAEAKAEAEEAFRLQPQLGESSLALAYYHYLVETNYYQALIELARADELIPNSSEVPRLRAFIYKRQDKIRERIAALERATALDPRDGTSLVILAITLRSVRDWPEEIRTRERVIEVRPEEAKLPWGLAMARFHASGDVAALKKAIDQAAPDADPMGLKVVRFEYSVMTRDFAEAWKWFDQIPVENFAQYNGSKVMWNGLLLMNSGADAATIKDALEKARMEFAPDAANNWEAQVNLALVDGFLGRKEDAIREAKAAAERNGLALFEKNDALAALAIIYAHNGEPDQALQLIEHLLISPADMAVATIYSLSLADLKHRWAWDPLRSNPRFQRILAGPEPETIYN